MPQTPGGRDLARIVEKQMRNWELARSQRPSAPASGGPSVAHFVTISRMVGAGGRQLALALGERLNWPIFDQEILQAMAGDDQVRRRLFHELDERDQGWIEDTLRWVYEGQFGRDAYFARLSETVLALARQGPAIFLGRGVDLILPREYGLRVYLVATFEDCANRLAARDGISPALARAEVDRIQHERSDFLRQHFGKRASEPARHDLVLNTSRFSLAEARDLVTAALQIKGAIVPA